MKKKIRYFSLLCFLPSLAWAQMEIITDTVYFTNKGKKVTVINTLNRQYYDDSACVWEVMYPEIFGLDNRVRETSINIMLSKEVAFGDCDEQQCDRATMYYPQLSKYWDKVTITSIRNDLLSYCLAEGHCPVYSKRCSGTTQFRLYNLRTGVEIAGEDLFKKDMITLHKLDSIILNKLDFVPEDVKAVRSERQFYFNKEKLFVFYDWYTLGKSETYEIELPYREIKPLINPAGALAIFFNEKTLSKK